MDALNDNNNYEDDNANFENLIIISLNVIK